jgi:lysophospholipase L1-like esterase
MGTKGSFRGTGRGRWLRGLGFRLGAVALALVLCSVLAELGLRLYDKPTLKHESLLSRRWEAGHVCTNTQAFRADYEYALSRPPGIGRRIAVVGDSFAFGNGVDREQTFAALLQEGLAVSGPDGGAEVLNFAQRGSETADELRRFRDQSRRYEFDGTVLAWFLNDIGAHDAFPEATAPPPEPPRGPIGVLYQRSVLFNFLYLHGGQLRLGGIGEAQSDYHATLFGLLVEPQRAARHRAELEQLADLAREGNRWIVAAMFPFPSIADRYPPAGVEAHRAMREIFAGLGVPVVDLLEVYAEHPGRKLAVSRFDEHPSALGHRLAAEALLPLIEAADSPR